LYNAIFADYGGAEKTMLKIETIRESFPFLDEAVYLNTAAVGLKSSAQEESATSHAVAKSRGILGRDEWVATLAQTKSRLSTLLGIRAEQVSFTGSTTEALNLAALGLPLEPGNRVALAADEFPSVMQPWLALREKNIEIERVMVPQESERTAVLAAAVVGGAHALAVSHVHWRTGTTIDLERLSAVCRKHCAWLVVDGVQAAGAIAVRAGLADAYCASSFKWLLSDFGLGFMTLSDQLASHWTPPFRGYGNEWPSRDPQYGHVNHPGISALNTSLGFLSALGWEDIYRRVGDLSKRLATTLREQGFEVVTPLDARAGIVSVRRSDAAELVRSLAEESIFVEDRDGLIRASPHFYNTDEDVDRFTAALVRHSLK
jgi:selenocysteine lyase/cysteine desulfurase